MNFMLAVALLLIPAIAANGGLKGASSNEIEAKNVGVPDFDKIDYQNVVGSFPTSPVYAVYSVFSDSTCGTETQVNVILTGSCLQGATSSSQITCASGVATYQGYSDTACATPQGSPFVLSTTCAVNPQTSGSYNAYYLGSCGGSSGYPGGTWDLKTNYYATTCNQVVQSSGFVDNYCYPDGGSQSFKYVWPNKLTYSASTTCATTAVSSAIPTTCAAETDDNGMGYNTFVQYSQSSASTVALNMKLMFSAIAVAFFFMKN